MKVEVKRVIWPSIVSSIFLFLFWLLLFLKSGETLIAISYFVGALLIAIGVIALIGFLKNSTTDVFNQLNIAYGVISIIAGIFLITAPEIIGSAIPIIVGVAVIISSSMKIQQSMVLKNIGSNYFLASMITSVLCLVCGVVLLFNPFKSAVVVTKAIGLFMMIYGVSDLINTIILKKSDTVSVEISTNKTKPKKAKDAKVVKEVEKKD